MPCQGYAAALEKGARQAKGWATPARVDPPATGQLMTFHATHSGATVRQKWVPKIQLGKWQHELNPVVPWWFNFDPYPCVALS